MYQADCRTDDIQARVVAPAVIAKTAHKLWDRHQIVRQVALRSLVELETNSKSVYLAMTYIT